MAETPVPGRSLLFGSIHRRPLGDVSGTTLTLGLWLVFLGNLALIVWLWIAGGNVTNLHGPGELLNSVGRITGLLGAYLSLVQILLLGRLPVLERLVGFDRLTLWHRINGKIVLVLVLGHALFSTVAYAVLDRISVQHEASVLISAYPGMIAAAIGTCLFIAVALSSLLTGRRRLRYETWYAVHLSAYAAIALAWVHQIPTGNEFITNIPAATYWTSLYLATIALMVTFRLAMPILHGFRYRLRVAEVTVEGPNAVSLRITGRNLEALNARAGQFFLWRFLDRERWWESHPFSLSAAPDGHSFRITAKQVGDFTRRIGDVRPGTAVLAEGPFGTFTDSSRRRSRVALIAGGIGITPIRALLEEMTGDLVLVYRVTHRADLIFRDELDALACGRGVTLHYVVGDRSADGAEQLLSSDRLSRLIPDLTDRDVYICGPPAMVDVVERNIRRLGNFSDCIHVERFAL